MINKNNVASIIKKINFDIDTYLLTDNSQLGLLSGDSGIAIFKLHYSKAFGERNDLDVVLLRSFKAINKGDYNPFFCGGISGFLYLFEVLKKENLLIDDPISKKDFDTLNNYLLKRYYLSISNGNCDFLHGAEGILFYFLNSNSSIKKADLIIEYLNYLENSRIYFGRSFAIYSSISSTNGMKNVFNLGMAHGMASTIRILTKIYESNENSLIKERSIKLLKGIVDFYFQVRIQDEICSFSNRAFDESSFSRLAWCYGDLSIGIALMGASKLFQDELVGNEALNICLKTTSRTSNENTGIKDAGICHGTAGLALMYSNLFDKSRIKEFKDASDFWVNKTIEKATFKDGVGGFKSYTNGGFQNEYSLLEGASGIGLVLLSTVFEKLYSWDDCLLIS